MLLEIGSKGLEDLIVGLDVLDVSLIPDENVSTLICA